MPDGEGEMEARDLQPLIQDSLHLTRNISYVRYQSNVESTKSQSEQTYDTFYHRRIDGHTWVNMDVDGLFDPVLFDECITPSLETLDMIKHLELKEDIQIESIKLALARYPWLEMNTVNS